MNLHSNSLTVGTVPLMNNMNLTAGMGRAISTMALKWGDRQAPLPPGDRSNCGDLELVKIDGKVVYLKLVGHCGSCPFAMMTLKQGIEAGLQEIDPEITVERVVE